MSERAVALAALAAVAACGAPTCDDVIDHLVGARLMASRVRAERLAACQRAPPSPDVRRCLVAATTTDEATRCRALDDQRAGDRAALRAPDEARLRALAHAVETYALDHGALPPASAGPLPAVGACCRDGRTGECPPDAARWTDPPWSALGFRVDGPSRASFWYEVTDPREAVVHAIFDLDCDGDTGQAVISVRVTGATAAASPMLTSYERD